MASIPLSDLRVKVYDRVENNTAFYPNSDVDYRINEALKITNLFTGWNQGRLPIGMSTAGRVFYRTPVGMLFITKLYLEGQELNKDSMSSLSDNQPLWVTGPGTRPSVWVPIGIRKLAIFPSDKKGGRFLEAWGVVEPAKLVNPTDVSALPDDQVDLLIEYAAMNLVLKEGGKSFSDAVKGYKPWLRKMRGLQAWERNVNPTFQVEVKQAA